MALPTSTLTDLIQIGLAYCRTSFQGFPLGTRTFLGRTIRAVALSIWGLHKALETLDADIIPSAKSSTDVLAEWASLLALPDGRGGYGPLAPTLATGGVATLTGTKGTVYPSGSVATAEDGTTQIELSGSVTIPGSGTGFGSITGQFIAITPGTDGNLPVGTVCSWDSAPSGADPTFTLTSPLEGGADTEDNPAVFGRIKDRLQTPPRGGVAEDYRLWAQQGGAGTTYVYPRRSGTGSTDIVITVAGSGQGRKPSVAIQTAVQNVIATKRPAAEDTVNVLLPYMPNASGHLVRVRVTPSRTKYNFDWDDTAGPYTVDLYGGGPPATLRLNTLAPATLKNAIDVYIAGNGSAPRLQVLSTGSVINLPIKAVAWSDGGGKTTLTLETVPSTWTTPTVGDTVYAYGPVVAAIADGILDLADALGSSRVSGYADAISPWFDTLSIAGIISVAESAIDSDGTLFLQNVPTGGATIDGVVADVRAADNSSNPPEILYLSHVAVTQ